MWIGDYCPLTLPRDPVQVTALFWTLLSFSAKQDCDGAYLLGVLGNGQAGHKQWQEVCGSLESSHYTESMCEHNEEPNYRRQNFFTERIWRALLA